MRRAALPTGAGDICNDDVSAAAIVVCFAYPEDRFKDKPTFMGAAFFVGMVDQPEKACLQGSSDWDVESVRNTRIHGITFRVFHASEWAANHGRNQFFYRVYHGARCYELGTQMGSASPGVFDPDIRKFTRQDWNGVHGSLNQIVRSFRFLR